MLTVHFPHMEKTAVLTQPTALAAIPLEQQIYPASRPVAPPVNVLERIREELRQEALEQNNTSGEEKIAQQAGSALSQVSEPVLVKGWKEELLRLTH